MRRIFPVLAMAFIVTGGNSLRAQGLGVKVGGSSSTFAVKSPVSPEMKRYPSIAGGLFTTFGKRAIALQAELLFMGKGARFIDPSSDSNDVKQKLNYIELPVSLLLRSSHGPYVFAGPSVAFEINCISEIRQGIVRVSRSCNEQNSPLPNRHKFDFGIGAGAGYQYQIGQRILMLEVREIWGLRDIDSDAGDEVRNRSFAVLLGYTSAPARRRGRGR